MAYTPLDAECIIEVIRPTGGGAKEQHPISEINTLISAEEDARITPLETAVGKYALTAKEVELTEDIAETPTANDYQVLAGDSLLVVTRADAGAIGDVLLPAAIGTQKMLVIKNLSAESFDAIPDGTDVIDINAIKATVTTKSSITLLDYAAGNWIII